MANELTGYEAMDLLIDRLERAILAKFESEQEAGECRDKLRDAHRERDALKHEIEGLKHDISTRDAQIAALRASQTIEPPPAPKPRSTDDPDIPF